MAGRSMQEPILEQLVGFVPRAHRIIRAQPRQLERPLQVLLDAPSHLNDSAERSLGTDDDAWQIIARGIESGTARLDQLTIG